MDFKYIFDTIILGIAATIIFEILKHIGIFIINKISEKSVSFSVSGYWCTYHEDYDCNNNKYKAYELLKIIYKKDKILLKIYQVASKEDDSVECSRFYKGVGCFRDNKLSFAYEEAANKHSNNTGVIILRTDNALNHTVRLIGNYSEIRQQNTKADQFPYLLSPFEFKKTDTIKFFLLGKNAVFNYMKRVDFRDACK